MTNVSETTTGAASAAFGSSISQASLGKEDFLQLLVAQLQNQDPLNPEDPTEFTSQLTQFSSLEQQMDTNKYLEAIVGNTGSEQTSALSMIGRVVALKDNMFELGSEGAALGYELGGTASEVKVSIYDESDNLVAILQGDGLNEGTHYLSWDGMGLNGEQMSTGTYRVAVEATDADGEVLGASTLVLGRVSGVDLDATGNILVTNAGEFNQSQVKSVLEL